MDKAHVAAWEPETYWAAMAAMATLRNSTIMLQTVNMVGNLYAARANQVTRLASRKHMVGSALISKTPQPSCNLMSRENFRTPPTIMMGRRAAKIANRKVHDSMHVTEIVTSATHHVEHHIWIPQITRQIRAAKAGGSASPDSNQQLSDVLKMARLAGVPRRAHTPRDPHSCEIEMTRRSEVGERLDDVVGEQSLVQTAIMNATCMSDNDLITAE
eukprot:3574565-Pyramimonas_sp.AAC.3